MSTAQEVREIKWGCKRLWVKK